MNLLKALTLGYRLNVIGLLSGLMLLYVALSGRPWWMLVGGNLNEPTFLAEVSPFKISMSILGNPVIIPILPYLTLAAQLTLLIASIRAIVGSLTLSKDWSKPLIPLTGLTMPIVFLAILYIGLQLVQTYAGVSVPINDQFIFTYNIPIDNATMKILTPTQSLISQEYWIALIAGCLSLVAKIAQGRALKRAKSPS